MNVKSLFSNRAAQGPIPAAVLEQRKLRISKFSQVSWKVKDVGVTSLSEGPEHQAARATKWGQFLLCLRMFLRKHSLEFVLGVSFFFEAREHCKLA